MSLVGAGQGRTGQGRAGQGQGLGPGLGWGWGSGMRADRLETLVNAFGRPGNCPVMHDDEQCDSAGSAYARAAKHLRC